jgi:hypothetical protein
VRARVRVGVEGSGGARVGVITRASVSALRIHVHLWHFAVVGRAHEAGIAHCKPVCGQATKAVTCLSAPSLSVAPLHSAAQQDCSCGQHVMIVEFLARAAWCVWAQVSGLTEADAAPMAQIVTAAMSITCILTCNLTCQQRPATSAVALTALLVRLVVREVVGADAVAVLTELKGGVAG